MRKVMREVTYSIKKNRFLQSLILLFFAIGLILCSFSLTSYQTHAQEGAEQNTDVNYYRMIDSFFSSHWDILSNDPNVLSKLKSFHQKLKESKDFNYMNLVDQYITVKDKTLNGKFYLQGTEDFPDSQRPVNCMWIDDAVLPQFSIQLQAGHFFEPKDYTFPTVDEIPLVLGNDYQEYYQLNDIVSIEHVFGTSAARVVGFLEQDAQISYNGSMENMNNYILFPMPSAPLLPSTKEEATNQMVLYTMKNNGQFVTSMSKEKLQTIIQEYCDELEISPSYVVDGAANQQSFIYMINVDQITLILLSLSILIMAFTCLSLCIYLLAKIRRNLKYYAVLLTCGFSLSDIKKMIFGEVCYFIVLANLIAFIPVLLIYSLTSTSFLYLFSIAIIDLIILLVATLLPFHELKKADLCLFLRRR